MSTTTPPDPTPQVAADAESQGIVPSEATAPVEVSSRAVGGQPTKTRPIESLIRHCVSLGIVAGGFALAFFLNQTAEEKDSITPPVKRLKVETRLAVDFEDPIAFSVDGLVASSREIAIVAEVGGRIVFKSDSCRVGRTVNKGELLVSIDPQTYQLELDRLDKDKVRATATLKESKLERDQAAKQIEIERRSLAIRSNEFQRMQRLFQQNAISISELDKVEQSLLAARTMLKNQTDLASLLEAKIVQTQASLDLADVLRKRAELDLKRTQIFAPIAGRITQRLIEQGGYVAAGGGLVTIQDDAQLEVKCSLFVWQLDWLRRSLTVSEIGNHGIVPAAGGLEGSQSGAFPPPAPAVVTFQIGQRKIERPARLVSYDGGGIDSQTRMVPVRLRLDVLSDATGSAGHARESARLMAGMFVKAFLYFRPDVPTVQVPTAAIRPGAIVWTVRDGVMDRSLVKVLASYSGVSIAHVVDGSLEAGSQVVVSPIGVPRIGQTVNVSSFVTSAVDSSKATASRGGVK